MEHMKEVNLPTPYRPIRQGARLYQTIAIHIEKLIVDGHLKPGDRLPSESELAEQLQVSRTAVREAIKALHEKGLVRVEVGRGTFVLGPSPERMMGHMVLLLRVGRVQPDDLIAARRLLEVEIAGLAAENRTEEDLEVLRRLVDEMESSYYTRRGAFLEAHKAFHQALAHASGNTVYPILVQPLHDILQALQRAAIDQDKAPYPGLVFHRQILVHVENKDAEGARDAMRADTDSRVQWYNRDYVDLLSTDTEPEAV